MNKVSSYKTVRTTTLLVSASGLFSLAPLYAQVVMPTNPLVTQGGIAIQQTTAGMTTITQSTQKAVINWNSFSIGSGNTVQFNQPGANAIVVNRVTGGGVSQIDGNLLANGQVWVLNPNGLLIGSGGQINTAGFLGTTAGLSDTDFMAGNYRFNDLSLRGAMLNNKGTIVSTQGGYAVLAGRQVINEGLIQANLGSVVLGGARSYALDVVGDRLLSFAVTSPLELATANGRAVLENSGTLQADGGRVQLSARTAKDVIGGVINTTGLVQANNAAMVNGTIVLDAGLTGTVNIAGTVSANHNAGSGGSIAITGGRIVNSGSLMANGLDSGGRISLFASQRLENTGTVSANAGQNGQGGVVTMITDLNNKLGVAAVSGSISVQGGSMGGNGGFVETSGSILNIGSGLRVNTSAAKGKSGNWLLDPINVEVINGGPDSPLGGGTSTIGANTIMFNLNTTDVTITTTGPAVSSEAGNITISSPIAWSSHTLTFSAHNNIIINANLNATGTGKLNYLYGQSSSNGAGSSVTVANGIKVQIPNPDNFLWKKGREGSVKGLVLENQFLRFGDGFSSSISNGSNLRQPQYFDASNVGCPDSWCKLTFAALPYSYAFAVGGSGSGTWNTNGLIFTGGDVYVASPIGATVATPAAAITVISTATDTKFTSQPLLRTVGSIDISRYNEGIGAITVSASIPASAIGLTGSNITISNTYSLGAQARFLKTESQITAGSSPLNNIRMWAVIPDDYFGEQDSTIKTKGNFTNTGFTQIAAQTDTSNALLVNDIPSTATVLAFSNSSGVDSLSGRISSTTGGTIFDMIGINPKTSLIQKSGDLDGYGLFAARNNLAANTSTGVVTFFGVAPNASFNALKDQLIAAADISATKPTVPPADLNNLLAGIKPPPQTALPPPPPPAQPPAQGSNLVDPNKPPPQSSPLDIDSPPPPPPSTQSAPPPAAPVNAPPPPVGSASAPPPVTTGPKPPAPAPAPAPVTPAATAATPVAPPPPSPVGDVKPPTPKDAADTGDKTLAAAAPPPPPSAASQSKRSNTPTSTVKVGSVIVETVAQVNVPAVAGEQRFSLSGNSAAW